MRYSVGFATGAVTVLGPRGLLVVRGENAEGEWAPLPGLRVCQDRARRWRQEHTWDKDGQCIFCSAHGGSSEAC